MNKDEALRLALEALELAHPRFGIATEKHKQAITAIKAALEAKNEPFCWYDMEHGEIQDVEWNRQKPTYEGNWKPLYTTPPQRKPLTDEEVNGIAKNYALNNPTTPLHFARAIEAAHGITGENK